VRRFDLRFWSVGCALIGASRPPTPWAASHGLVGLDLQHQPALRVGDIEQVHASDVEQGVGPGALSRPRAARTVVDAGAFIGSVGLVATDPEGPDPYLSAPPLSNRSPMLRSEDPPYVSAGVVVGTPRPAEAGSADPEPRRIWRPSIMRSDDNEARFRQWYPKSWGPGPTRGQSL
jgi:hypothetical protein